MGIIENTGNQIFDRLQIVKKKWIKVSWHIAFKISLLWLLFTYRGLVQPPNRLVKLYNHGINGWAFTSWYISHSLSLHLEVTVFYAL